MYEVELDAVYMLLVGLMALGFLGTAAALCNTVESPPMKQPGAMRSLVAAALWQVFGRCHMGCQMLFFL
jgi:hypothetical protein